MQSFHNGFESDGRSLRFDAVATTRMMCSPEAMKIEDAFTHALERVRSYRIVRGRLRLYAADGSVLVTLKPAE